jgi:hypothetical protein
MIFKVVTEKPAAAQGLLAVAPLVIGALKIAIPLIQKVVRNEGAKFEATSVASAYVPMSVERDMRQGERPILSNDAAYYVLRIVTISEDDLKTLTPQEQAAWHELKISGPRFDRSALLDKLTPSNEPRVSSLRVALQEQINKQAGSPNAYLAFAAVGSFSRQKESGNEEFYITFDRYTFNARKAKALTGTVSRLDKRDDRLVVAITPPQGLTAAAGGAYGASMAFPLTLSTSPLEVTESNTSSHPIAVPPFKTWNLTASLVETSDFKAVLEKLAEQVGKLDPEDLVSKLQ